MQRQLAEGYHPRENHPSIYRNTYPKGERLIFIQNTTSYIDNHKLAVFQNKMILMWQKSRRFPCHKSASGRSEIAGRCAIEEPSFFWSSSRIVNRRVVGSNPT